MKWLRCFCALSVLLLCVLAGGAGAPALAHSLPTPKLKIIKYPIHYGWGVLDLALGSDDRLWFTEYQAGRIGAMTPRGRITHYPLQPYEQVLNIITGPDGNAWFTDGEAGWIGKMTPHGHLTWYKLYKGVTDDITTGPDGNLWFTTTLSFIGKITPQGQYTRYSLPNKNSATYAITSGPDGNLWFTDGGATSTLRPKYVHDRNR